MKPNASDKIHLNKPQNRVSKYFLKWNIFLVKFRTLRAIIQRFQLYTFFFHFPSERFTADADESNSPVFPSYTISICLSHWRLFSFGEFFCATSNELITRLEHLQMECECDNGCGCSVNGTSSFEFQSDLLCWVSGACIRICV